MKIFTTEELNEKTVIELRELCKKYDIPSVSKARKDDIIYKIEEFYDDHKAPEKPSSYETKKEDGKLPFVNANLSSILQKDETYKTFISVSCGAASNNYPVIGRSVGFVKATYREILNIDDNAEGIVNGEPQKDSYILKFSDCLEFVRKAGTKG